MKEIVKYSCRQYKRGGENGDSDGNIERVCVCVCMCVCVCVCVSGKTAVSVLMKTMTEHIC